MAAVARERIAAEGWPNVTVVQSPAEDAKIPVTADAALFCAVHDILQSPGALQNIMSSLRPGAWVAAGGGKWAPWAMMALNLQVRTLHAPYVRSFAGFGRLVLDELEDVGAGHHRPRRHREIRADLERVGCHHRRDARGRGHIGDEGTATPDHAQAARVDERLPRGRADQQVVARRGRGDEIGQHELQAGH